MRSRFLEDGRVAVKIVYYAYEDEERDESHGLLGGRGSNGRKYRCLNWKYGVMKSQMF